MRYQNDGFDGESVTVRMSSDAETVEYVRTGLIATGGYCPCRAVKNADTKCMCKEFREQIEAHKPGPCHCGLYIVTIE